MLLIKAVIFDVDGTLVDTLDIMAEAAEIVAKEFGLTGNIREIKNFVGMKPEDIIREFFKVKDEEKIQKIKKRWAEEALRLVADEKKARLFPGVIETLKWLKANGIKTAVGSSLLTHMIEKIGEAYGFLKYIDEYVGSDQVKNGKPDPETFLKAAEKLGVKPSEAIVIGDTHYDIIAGKKGGFKTILFDPIDRYNNVSLEVAPDFKVKTYQEIKAILEKLIGDTQ